jgi:AcrR family transcriptional regulator
VPPAKPARAATDADSSDRRSEILGIASSVFARKGFVAATVREIADEAGILSGSLYHHFDSKESMIDEILSDFYAAVVADYQRVVDAGDDPVTTLRNLVLAQFAAMSAYPAAAIVAHGETAYLGQFERFAHLTGNSATIEGQWTSVIRAGQDTGAFRAEVDAGLAFALIRDAIWITVRWRDRSPFTVEEVADTYLDLYLDGLRPRPVRGRRADTAPR